MNRFALITAAMIAAASGTAAKELTVRSGEHKGFTRLVVHVPPDTGWVLKHTKNGARLNVALKDATYEISSVFRRLTQDRLAAMSQEKPGAALELKFGCECVASAYLFKNTMIVIDIAPGSLPPSLISDVPVPVLPEAREEEPAPKPEQVPDTLALPLLRQNANSFEDQLSTRLLQGADRDIVDLNVAAVGPRASTSKQEVFLPPDLEMNIQVTSILDDLEGLLGADIPELERRRDCISSDELSFEDWSDDRPFAVQAAQLRSGLFQEFDVIDTQKALDLAKLYAYSGFGAEAMTALNLLADQSPEADRIAAIGRVLDNGPFTDSNPFAGLQRCDSDAALWAVLTEGNLQEDANLTAIEQSFVRLPDHLRRHVGPALSDILVDGKELEAARRVLRSVDRVNTQANASLANAKASIASAEGDASRTETFLTEAIEASDAMFEAPIALARLVDKRWRERGSVSSKELDLAESYTVEFRHADIGEMMQRTHAVALSLGQEFDAALDALTELPEDKNTADALDRVVLILTERAEDATFSRRIMAMPQQQSDGLKTDTALAVANRLAELGFSRQARALANRPQDKVRRDELARVRAKAALLDQRPHQALLELAEDHTDETIDLRAEALEAAGEFAAAGALMRDTGRTDDASRLYWLADQTDEADLAQGEKFDLVIKSTQGLTAEVDRLPDTPLADAENLLRDSAETRQMIADLLGTLVEN